MKDLSFRLDFASITQVKNKPEKEKKKRGTADRPTMLPFIRNCLNKAPSATPFHNIKFKKSCTFTNKYRKRTDSKRNPTPRRSDNMQLGGGCYQTSLRVAVMPP